MRVNRDQWWRKKVKWFVAQIRALRIVCPSLYSTTPLWGIEIRLVKWWRKEVLEYFSWISSLKVMPLLEKRKNGKCCGKERRDEGRLLHKCSSNWDVLHWWLQFFSYNNQALCHLSLSFSHKKWGVYFSIPWFWVQPYNLLCPMGCPKTWYKKRLTKPLVWLGLFCSAFCHE